MYERGNDMDLNKLSETLKKKKYEVSVFKNKEDAAEYLNQKIDGKVVGFGDSETLASMGLYEKLVCHNRVFDPMHSEEGEDFFSTARKCLTTDIFLTSVNGMSETGEMVNIDGTGNRVAGSLFGHEKVYFVLGTNKIAPTLDEAKWRAHNIAAPMNAARHHFKTPCSIREDHCYDCKSPDRICNAEVVYYQKMRFIEMEIILIDEKLGF